MVVNERSRNAQVDRILARVDAYAMELSPQRVALRTFEKPQIGTFGKERRKQQRRTYFLYQ